MCSKTISYLTVPSRSFQFLSTFVRRTSGPPPSDDTRKTTVTKHNPRFMRRIRFSDACTNKQVAVGRTESVLIFKTCIHSTAVAVQTTLASAEIPSRFYGPDTRLAVNFRMRASSQHSLTGRILGGRCCTKTPRGKESVWKCHDTTRTRIVSFDNES